MDEESSLVKYARTELALVGNGPAIDEPLIEIVKIFSQMGHSGSSAAYTISVLERLLAFRNLAPLTNDPEEWFYHGGTPYVEGEEFWQNKRNGEAFSTDGGKTYYLLSEVEPDKDKVFHTSVDMADLRKYLSEEQALENGG